MNSDGCITPLPCLSKTAELCSCGLMIEPYGEYSFSELKKRYTEAAEKYENPQSFLLKNMCLMSDLRAGVLACIRLKKPVYALLEIDGELLTSAALPADAALIALQSMGLAGFGIVSDDMETVKTAVERLVRFAKIPIFAKTDSETAERLAASGIITKKSEEFYFFEIPAEQRETAIMLSNERQAFFLEPDTTEISEPISCQANLDEILCDASQESYDVLRIEINTPDDAVAFTECAHMAALPVMFSCEDDISLKLALMLYQGRALIDSTCCPDEETVEKTVKKYGAVVY